MRLSRKSMDLLLPSGRVTRREVRKVNVWGFKYNIESLLWIGRSKAVRQAKVGKNAHEAYNCMLQQNCCAFGMLF